MNEFSVVWEQDAEDELISLWTQAGDRASISRAADQIERLLRRNPAGNGQHLSEELYRLDVDPLRVIYSIDAAARQVTVSRVRLLNQPEQGPG